MDKNEIIRKKYREMMRDADYLFNYMGRRNDERFRSRDVSDALFIHPKTLFWFGVAEILHTSTMQMQGDLIGTLQGYYDENIYGSDYYSAVYDEDFDWHKEYIRAEKYFRLSPELDKMGIFWKYLIIDNDMEQVGCFYRLLCTYEKKLIPAIEDIIELWEEKDRIENRWECDGESRKKKIAAIRSDLRKVEKKVKQMYDHSRISEELFKLEKELLSGQ